jgi:pimeloyl-ACP methyl ester carboxylesterase
MNCLARTIDLGGLPLRLWEYPAPEKDAPRILLLHGFLDTGRSFDWAINALDGAVHAFALDFRGHGQSKPVPPGASAHLLDHCKDAFRVIRSLLNEGPLDAVVAHSMGGNVALMIAGASPSLFPKMMLIDALGGIPEPAEEQPERLGRLLEGLDAKRPFSSFETREAALERLRSYNPHLSQAAAERMATHSLSPDPEDPERVRFAFDTDLKGPVPFRYEEGAWRTFCHRFEGRTRVLRCGKGYLPSREDDMVRARIEAFRQVTWVEIEEAGHHLHVEDPQRLAEEIRRLLGIVGN